VRHKQPVRFLLIVLIALTFVGKQVPIFAGRVQQAQRQPGPGKKFVATPFGPIEVDASDPRPAVAVGPPAEPTQPPPGALAAPTPAQAQAPAQAQPGQGQADQELPVLLNIDNQDLYPVVRTIGGILGINFVIEPTVRGTVNIGMNGTVRRSDLFGILEAILKMNGATMIKAGNFYQIVPAATAVRMPLEIQSAQPPVAPDDQIVVQIVPMKYVAADEMARLLTPYVSEAGNIVAQGSILLVTDRRSNLRKLMEIVDEFDTRAFQGERVRILPVKNTRVKDIIDDLKTVFSGYALSNSTAIRFLPIERLNSVLVVTPDPDVFSNVERWLDRLDQPVQTAGLHVYVYKLKNSKATDIQRVLSELFSDTQIVTPAAVVPIPTGGPGVVNPTNPPTQAAAAAAALFNNGAQAGVGGANVTNRLTGQLRIVADQVNNQLVIQATSQDYQGIAHTIEELDVLPRQVLIDAQIYEVSLDHSMTLGLSAVLQQKGTLANPLTTASFTATGGLAATTFAFIGRSRELVAFLNATENKSKVRTLSAPSLLVSNNALAQVEVGADVPVPTSSAASGAQQGGSTLFAQTIEFRTTGVILNVTPHINEGGNVTLEISQEVSQAGANTTSSINAPVIGKSSVKSTIVVQNGETIPLTGFIRENDSVGKNRVPLLGSLPVAGLLFGNTTKSTTRSELIVLITPHVVTTVDERAAAAQELKAKLRESQRLINQD
jgi:general secretion pathway protein D